MWHSHVFTETRRIFNSQIFKNSVVSSSLFAAQNPLAAPVPLFWQWLGRRLSSSRAQAASSFCPNQQLCWWPTYFYCNTRAQIILFVVSDLTINARRMFLNESCCGCAAHVHLGTFVYGYPLQNNNAKNHLQILEVNWEVENLYCG